MPRRIVRSWSAAFTVLAIVGLASPAFAGPPLLCNPFDIGNAASLPWDGSRAFWQGRSDYRLANLLTDTDALLTPSAPVIVRMETIRRAAIYGSADSAIAARLYAQFSERLRTAEKTGRPGALAIFDLAYLTETYRQIADLDRGESAFQGRAPALRRIIAGTDGYALVTRSLALWGDDPAVDFAAALMRGRRDDPFRVHAERARAGASRDPLLARNIGHIS